ncbi:MAG: lepB [Chlamydiales bacterium]|jgi:signal peptidase I|nr:lepB [Chlamydiales bacterium]
MPFFKRPPSWNKCRHIFYAACQTHRKKSGQLSEADRQRFEKLLLELEYAVKHKDKKLAREKAPLLLQFIDTHFQKTWADYAKEIVAALAIAFLLAVVVRQTLFEFYEIPTGSMRPNYREQDRLLVSKTSFGINIPLVTDHLYFNAKALKRGGVIVWSGDQVDLENTDSTFFGLPYKKRFIKRVCGLPGDTLYFYGGRIFGRDAAGNPIAEFAQINEELQVETIPFHQFEGRQHKPNDGRYFSSKNRRREIVLSYFNRPLARISLDEQNSPVGDIFTELDWKRETWVPAQKGQSGEDQLKAPRTLSDFWGMGNYAMARLIRPEHAPKEEKLADALIYLELRHHLNVNINKPILLKGKQGHWTPIIQPFTSFIPLYKEGVEALKAALYTARFIVKNGKAVRYSAEESNSFDYSVDLEGIPDGCYEFEDGIAYEIGFAGITKPLERSHPLYRDDIALTEKLFNFGIKWANFYEPSPWNYLYFPERFAYFKEGQLFVMGHPILKREDASLLAFQAKEDKLYQQATANHPYLPFVDSPPPLVADGGIDPQFLKAFGLAIPLGHYLVLGDNHANSLDGRYFGFLPEANIQGAPIFRFWPPGGNLGFLPNAQSALSCSRTTIVVWLALLSAISILYRYQRRRAAHWQRK